MWEMCCSDHKFVAMAAPRGHAKSTAITHAYTLANIVFRARSFALIVSDTETQSTFFLQDLKKELTENEDLMTLFGIKGLAKDAGSDFIIEFHDGKQARVIAKGAGQSLRGVKWDGKRPDLVVCDDLENEEIVMNKERRIKFQRWFTGTLQPCLSKNGIIRVVGTILHMDSQLQRLMPRESRRDRITETALSIKGSRKDIWYSIKYRAHDKHFTVALWPQYKSLEWLRIERQSYIDQGLTDIWSQEMLNVPMDEERAPFKRADFIPMQKDDWDQNFHYYVGTDLAVTLEQKSDYSAFVIGAVNPQGELHIVHVIQERLESDEIEERLFSIIEHYNPELVFFEKGQIWSSVEPFIINGMQRRNLYFSYEALPSITDKVSRSGPIRSRMRVGAVKFNKGDDWWPDFEEELMRFPRGGHDDQVDALSLLGRGLNKFVEAPTDDELADEQYEDEKVTFGFYEQGRSAITGY